MLYYNLKKKMLLRLFPTSLTSFKHCIYFLINVMLYYNGGKCLFRLFPTFLTFLTLQTYRDGVQVSPRSPGTPSFLFANQNYECNGNEAVLGDCSQNSRICSSGQRSYLTCKGKLSFIFTQTRFLSLSKC